MPELLPKLRAALVDTPLRDLFRGRVTGRLNWPRQLAASSLPRSTQRRVAKLVRNTRLGRLGQATIASELIDQLESGAASEQALLALLPSDVARRRGGLPFLDLLRLRFGGPDWRNDLAAVDLPEDTKQIISAVVRRTRLWRSEKSAVTIELIHHFLDARDAGQSNDDAADAFGDPRLAARMIRRAKIRNRPLPWQALRVAWHAALVLLIIYALLGLEFQLRRPRVTVDYAAVLNAQLPKTDAKDGAWPLYREAIGLAGEPREWPRSRRTDDARWRDDADWLRRNRQIVAAFCEAAAKPDLGRPITRRPSPEDVQFDAWTRAIGSVNVQDSTHDRVLAQVPADSLHRFEHTHVGWMLNIADFLASDTRLAVEEKDGPRIERNIEATLNMSNQLMARHDGSEFATISLRNIAFRQVTDVLRRDSSLLSDYFLKTFPYQIAPGRVARDWFDLRAARLATDDLVQRVFTDDGQGNGRLTPEGQKILDALRFDATRSETALSNTVAQLARGPAEAWRFADRATTVRELKELLNYEESLLNRPLRDIDAAEVGLIEYAAAAKGFAQFLPSMSSSGQKRTAYLLTHAENCFANRDGATLAIALERHRRDHGALPETLGALVPAYVSELPVDRIDGKPLHYRVIDGKACVYSTGTDADDDGGVPPLPTNRRRVYCGVELSSPRFPRRQAPDGDWVIYDQRFSPEPQ